MNLILHGSWHSGTLFVWGESSDLAPRPRGRKPRIPAHPYAAPPDALREAMACLVPHGNWTRAAPATRIALLPSTADTPQLPPWLVADEAAEDEVELHLSPWKVSGLALDLLSVLDLLIALPAGSVSARQTGKDLRYWSLVAKLGLELLAQHKYLPGLIENEGQYRAVWLPVLNDLQDRARLRALAQAMPPICRALFDGDATPSPNDAPPPHTLLDDFLKQLVDQAVRDWGHSLRGQRVPNKVAILISWQ